MNGRFIVFICLMTIFLIPAPAVADRISGDEIKQQCENYQAGSKAWKTGCGLYVQSPLPYDTACDCHVKCSEAYSACKSKCLAQYGMTPELGSCSAACLYAANRCGQKCRPCNPNAQ